MEHRQFIPWVVDRNVRIVWLGKTHRFHPLAELHWSSTCPPLWRCFRLHPTQQGPISHSSVLESYPYQEEEEEEENDLDPETARFLQNNTINTSDESDGRSFVQKLSVGKQRVLGIV